MRDLDGVTEGTVPAPPSRREPAGALPLCVDLDGTLVLTDTLVENVLGLLAAPRSLLALPGWLARGKAGFKAAVAEAATLDAALLPYNQPLLRWLEGERARGRPLILVTAAHRSIAERVAGHLGLFDEVIATDGADNLRGERKAERLVERFGTGGFAYAGNDATDLKVWARSGAAVLVDTPPGVTRRARALGPIEQVFDDRPSRLAALVTALRPYQWAKNLLVFVPILTANAIGDVIAWSQAVLMFLAFCATASAIYLINDLTDLAADRQHERKRRRPFASGALPAAYGLAAAPLLLLAGTALGLASGALLVLAVYAAVSFSYSIKLKELPLVDLFALAALYTLRLFGGGEATGYTVSLWLLAFSSFFFLSLAIIKRAAELMALRARQGRRAARRGYSTEDLEILQAMGVGASFVSSMVLALYVQSDVVAGHYGRPEVLWAIVPLMLFWQCRVWLSTARGYMHDDPIIYAAKDWVSRLVVLCLFGTLLLAKLPA